ncbi:hypothetical protein [Anaerotruncus colihominis]|uniref:hypothetical protein n=1 Tax=Anaerotruncus colihominis TaxID=169435 RepID=UPI001899A327|nr:hypothetical protein [Anaerotruncus colihominis]
MAALVRMVPREDWEVLKKYLTDTEGCVLLSESVLEGLPKEQREQLQTVDNCLVEYDYGGDADIWVDMVQSPDAYFLKDFFGNNEPDYEVDCDEECYGCGRSCADRIEPSL